MASSPPTAYTYAPKEAHLASEQEACGDGRVDVAAADVPDHPDDRRDADAERERDADDVAALARPAADHHQQPRPDQLGHQRHPEVGRPYLVLRQDRHTQRRRRRRRRRQSSAQVAFSTRGRSVRRQLT